MANSYKTIQEPFFSYYNLIFLIFFFLVVIQIKILKQSYIYIYVYCIPSLYSYNMTLH